ncbi:hypothetical protein BpHYR1_036086 [Brachionus plicatilis]|uniref:Uncharacterized protein n=1 Tax=Brachionus plicatilis TaxID=10195 RepID=A0A3M7R8W9_BRAPC|nr:hypothetical protein BpHYR1_036086 [Brachionus plicatilis]
MCLFNRDLIGQLMIYPELSLVMTSPIFRSLIVNQDFIRSSVYQGYTTVEVQPVSWDAFLTKELNLERNLKQTYYSNKN